MQGGTTFGKKMMLSWSLSLFSHPGKVWKKVLASEARWEPKGGMQLATTKCNELWNKNKLQSWFVKKGTMGVGLAGWGVEEIKSGSWNLTWAKGKCLTNIFVCLIVMTDDHLRLVENVERVVVTWVEVVIVGGVEAWVQLLWLRLQYDCIVDILFIMINFKIWVSLFNDSLVFSNHG